MRRWVLFYVALVVGTVLDLGTKWWAFEALPHPRSSMPITSWFAFTHATNKGAAFGLFEGQFDFFMLVTLLALVAVPCFVHTAPRRSWGLPIVLGLILSGVIGNFWDRAIHGHVRDFLDVHTPPAGWLHDQCERLLGRTVWPTFNVADVFITGGALLMILVLGKDEKKVEAPAKTPEPAAVPPAAVPPAEAGPTPATEAAPAAPTTGASP